MKKGSVSLRAAKSEVGLKAKVGGEDRMSKVEDDEAVKEEK